MEPTPAINIGLRILEITAELAEMKRSFFVDGIEQPMSKRVKLESELHNLKLQKFKLQTEERNRSLLVKQIRAEILKKKLEELGFPNLISECAALAELQVSAIGS